MSETKELITRSKNYGEVARYNGLNFEKIICEYYNCYENKKKFIKKVSNIYPNIDDNGMMVVCQNNKVESIYDKKTTKKADLWYIYGDNNKISISVKMTNKGTQLQVISLDNLLYYLSFNDIKVKENIILILKKFLGLIQPEQKELIKINKNRTFKNKYKKRYFINELNEEDQKDILLELILKNGLCKNENDKANIFIFNNSHYSKTKKILPSILTYDELISKYIGKPKITKQGNLELNENIGIQMKGSGNGASYHYIQFKDRGIQKILN